MGKIMAIIHHKRGIPFSKTCKWLNEFGNPIDLTAGGITVTSQVRHPITDELIADMVVTYPTATTYKLRVADTALWPLDRLLWDIHYHQAGQDELATETMYIDVSSSPTRS